MSDIEKAANLPVIIIGAGGHACVVADALLSSGAEILGFTDTSIPVGTEIIHGLSVLGDDDILSNYSSKCVMVAIGIGFLPGNQGRSKIFERVKNQGFTIKSVRHPSSVIGLGVTLEEGSQLMAGTVVQPNSKIGMNVIVNTRASIDHDCIIGGHSHIACGAIICGGVTIEENCFIGAGAIVIQGVEIGSTAVIAAGVTVKERILAGQKYFAKEKHA